MLRILYIIPDLSKGGAERFAVDMYKALSNRTDVDLRLATLNKRNDYDFITNQLPPIITLNSYYKPSISGKTQMDISEYEKLIREFSPDIIHTHLFFAELFSASKVYPHIVYVTHGHDNMVQFNKLGLKDIFCKTKLTNYYEKQLLYRKKYRTNPTWIIANSQHTEHFYRSVVPKNMKDKVKLLYNPFDYHRFYKSEDNKVSGTLKLINVGSFQDKKNQKFILPIARRLLQYTTDFEIHLLGDGQNRPLLEQQTQQQGLAKNIIFHGNVNNVEDYLHRSHIYLHTAWYEPFGLVFLEAMAAGLPIVTLDGKGNRDIIEQGKNGFLYENEDADQFAKTIVELKNNADKYSEMSNYAKMYAKKFDMETQVDKFIDFYHEILKQR